MKKKTTKRLVLAKETLRELERRDMHKVVAGERYSFACNPDQGTYWCASVRVACKETPY